MFSLFAFVCGFCVLCCVFFWCVCLNDIASILFSFSVFECVLGKICVSLLIVFVSFDLLFVSYPKSSYPKIPAIKTMNSVKAPTFNRPGCFNQFLSFLLISNSIIFFICFNIDNCINFAFLIRAR